MRKHTKIYMKALGYDTCDFIPCEITGSRAIDTHHIVNREDRIENLMALTRVKHTELGEIKSKMGYLLETHRDFLMMNGVKFDNKWFNDNIEKYKAYEVR